MTEILFSIVCRLSLNCQSNQLLKESIKGFASFLRFRDEQSGLLLRMPDLLRHFFNLGDREPRLDLRWPTEKVVDRRFVDSGAEKVVADGFTVRLVEKEAFGFCFVWLETVSLFAMSYKDKRF